MADKILVDFDATNGKLLSKLREQRKAYEDIEEAEKDVGRESDKSTQKQISNSDKVEKTNSKLGASFKRLGGLIAGAFAIDRIVRFGSEAIALAGKLEGVRSAFNQLNNPRLLDDLRKATRGTVTDLELMQSAVRAQNFKVPLNQLAGFFEFATKRAAQTGEEVDYLVNSIIDGIGRKSTLVLDNLGISATELQAEIKKTGDFGEAAGNIIQRELEKAGDVAETTAQKTARLNATLENQKTILGQQLTPAWNAFLETVTFGLGQASDKLEAFSFLMRDDIPLSERLSAAWNLNAEGLAALNRALDNTNKAEDQRIKNSNEFYNILTKGLHLEEEKVELTEDQTKALWEQANAMYQVQKATQEALAAIDAEMEGFDFSTSLNLDTGGLSEFSALGFDDFEDEAGVMIEGFDETTKKMAELGIDNMSDYFEYLKNNSKEANEEMLLNAVSFAQSAANGILAVAQAQNEAELEAFNQKTMKQEEAEIASLNRMFNAEVSKKRLSDTAKAKLEEDYRAREEAIRQKYEQERLKNEAEAAEKRKNLALAQAIINTALAVTEFLVTGQLAAAVLAGIKGAAQVAIIESTPVPQYYEGTDYLQPWAAGQGTKKDDIPVMAHKGEAIIPAERNAEYQGMASAWINGTLDDYIFKNFQMPAIHEALEAVKKQSQMDFASNVANSMALNFMDKNMVKELKKGNKIMSEWFPELAKSQKRSIKHV